MTSERSAMDFCQAMSEVRKYGRVRRATWLPGYYIMRSTRKDMIYLFNSGWEMHTYEVSFADMDATDWSVLTEVEHKEYLETIEEVVGW